jgi:hypothetical protein
MIAAHAPPVRSRDRTQDRPLPDDGTDAHKAGINLPMQIPGVHIETLHNPVRYTYAQIEKACAIAQLLNRGKLVLVEPPRR